MRNAMGTWVGTPPQRACGKELCRPLYPNTPHASSTKSRAISTELIRQASATITAPRAYPTEGTSPRTAAASPENTTFGRGGRRPAGDRGARFTPGYSHEKGEKTATSTPGPSLHTRKGSMLSTQSAAKSKAAGARSTRSCASRTV
jgi:hypothetical protein